MSDGKEYYVVVRYTAGGGTEYGPYTEKDAEDKAAEEREKVTVSTAYLRRQRG